MVNLASPLSLLSTKVLLLGSGELGKEVAIELQRFGVEVVAVDRYANAPAMQVAHRSHVISMIDPIALAKVIELEKPDFIVPEIEAIATEVLAEYEKKGMIVIPTARAAQLTMNREGIRRLAAEELKLKTSAYRFVDSKDELLKAVEEIGFPCVIKPIMSSSGKGQSVIRTAADIEKSWRYAQSGGRTGNGRVIVEGFVDFDYEITLLTIRHSAGTSFCDPIGHVQVDGDYRESWQPHQMSKTAILESQKIAASVTGALGGRGVFGVELFIKGDSVYFSEVSPRPHDTGLVTLISQNLSEFALHARAILGLPIPEIIQLAPSASVALLAEGDSKNVIFENVDQILSEAGTELRLFGKPEVVGKRRMGVVLARDSNVELARARANRAASKFKYKLR